MKRRTGITTLLSTMLFVAAGSMACAAESPIDPCLNCHNEETPDIVKQWEAGKHSKTGVKCYVCHHADESDSKGMEHNSFFVVTSVGVQTCESCHPENAKDLLSKFTGDSGKHP